MTEEQLAKAIFDALPDAYADAPDAHREEAILDALINFVANGPAEIAPRRRALVFCSAVAARLAASGGDFHPRSASGSYVADVVSPFAFSAVSEALPDDPDEFPDLCFPE